MQLGIGRRPPGIWICIFAAAILFSDAGNAGDAANLSAAFSDAERRSKTPVGNKYELELFPFIAQTLADAVRTCGGPTKKWYRFDIVFIVSADGHIRRALHTPNQPIAACIAAKLLGKKVPRPPGDSWPVGAKFNNKDTD